MGTKSKPAAMPTNKDLASVLDVYIPFARQIGQRIASVRARQKKLTPIGTPK